MSSAHMRSLHRRGAWVARQLAGWEEGKGASRKMPQRLKAHTERAVASAFGVFAYASCVRCWAEAHQKIARMTLTIKLDRNWSSFQLANSAPPLSVTGSAIAPSARMREKIEVNCGAVWLANSFSPASIGPMANAKFGSAPKFSSCPPCTLPYPGELNKLWHCRAKTAKAPFGGFLRGQNPCPPCTLTPRWKL